MPTIQELQIVITANTSQAVTGLNQVSSASTQAASQVAGGWRTSMASVSQSLTSVGGSLMGLGASITAAVTGPFIYSIKAASDLNEGINKTKEVFGSAASSILAFAESSATSLGLSKSAALDAAGGFGNLFTQLGILPEKAAQMSTSIVTLAADFASFHNADISEVLNSQSAAFRGEYDSLQRFLPLISAATVEQEALAMTGKKATKELTAQDKALAVNALMFKGAGAAVGDFARTSDGMANVMRIVKAQLENLATELGSAFLPYVQQALTVVRNWMKAFTDLSPEVKKTIITIVGFGAALGPVILGIGLAATALGTLLSPIGLVVAAVALLGVAFATNFGGIRDTVTKWVGEAKKYYADHKDELDALGKKVKEIFQTYIQDLSKAASDLVAMLDRMKSSIDGFSTTNDGSWKAIAAVAKIALLAINAFANTMILGLNVALIFVKTMWSGVEGLILDPIKKALNWIKSNASGFEAAFSAITSAAKIGLVVKSPPLAAKWIMMIGDAAEDNAKRVSQSAKDYKAGFDLITSAIGVTGEVARILIEKFPEIAKELYGQSVAAKQASEAFELYGRLIQTTAGENTNFAKTVQENINKIFAQDKALRETITPVKHLAGAIEEVTIVTKEMGEAIATSISQSLEASVGSLERLIGKLKSSKAALAEWGKVMSEGVKKVKDEIKSNLGDGVGGVLIELAGKFKINLTKVNDWSSGVLDIIGAMPGKLGEKLRGATNKFLDFVNGIDRMLKGLHKIFDGVPDGLSGMISKIAGIFKSKTPAAAKTWDDFLGNLNKSTQKGMSGILGTLGKAAGAAAGILGGIGTFMGSRNQGKVTGVLGGAMGGMATGAAIGSLFGPGPGTAIGAGIGAAAGAILGLFGSGKSKEQKRAEEEAKQRAALDMQRAAADIMGAQMEGLKKGLELLEGLKTFSEVPRKAIKRFFNEIELVLQLFAEMAGKFKADSLAASKALTESMGESFGLLLSGADLIKAISEVASITDENIADFINTTVKIIEKWAAAAATIEMQSAKMTSKISGKLMSSFEFLRVVPEVIKGFAESVKLDDSAIDAVFASASQIITKMKQLSEDQRGLELNKAGASAGMFGTIFEASKSMLELFTQLAAYKPLDDAILNTITSDLQKLLSWGDGLIALGESGIAKFETLQSVISRMAAAMRGATAGISALTGGGSSTGITANIQSQSGVGLLARTASSPSSTPSVINNTTNVTQNVHGSVYAGRELVDEIRKVVKEENEKLKKELHLASVSSQ
jgi:hypothetical protein